MPARRRRRAHRWPYRQVLRRSARSMRAPPPWTGWSRSRSAASPSRRPRRPASGTTTGSTSSTPRATSTSPSRSSGPARPRRRGRGVRRRRRRRAAVRDGVAPGRQVQSAAHVLRQQARSHRRELRDVRRHDQGPARRPADGHAAADRHREQLCRRRRPGQQQRNRLARGRASARVRDPRHPRRHEGRRRPRRACT